MFTTPRSGLLRALRLSPRRKPSGECYGFTLISQNCLRHGIPYRSCFWNHQRGDSTESGIGKEKNSGKRLSSEFASTVVWRFSLTPFFPFHGFVAVSAQSLPVAHGVAQEGMASPGFDMVRIQASRFGATTGLAQTFRPSQNRTPPVPIPFRIRIGPLGEKLADKPQPTFVWSGDALGTDTQGGNRRGRKGFPLGLPNNPVNVVTTIQPSPF